MQRALGGADWRTIINRGELGRGGLAMPTCLPASLLNAVRTFLHWETNNTENMQLLGGAMNSGEYSLSALQLFTNCDLYYKSHSSRIEGRPHTKVLVNLDFMPLTQCQCHSSEPNQISETRIQSLCPF